METIKRKNVFIFRHGRVSNGAKLLSDCLGIKMIKQEDSNFRGGKNKIIINWGNGRGFPFDTGSSTIINPPERVALVTNKKTFFEICRESGIVNVPDFTTSKSEAVNWLEDGGVVFARTVLQGSGGEGIIELATKEDLTKIPDGTLLVKYIKKKREFRIHIGGGDLIFCAQEKKKSDNVLLENINWRIRNHKNGFVFCRNDISIPKKVLKEAINALEVSGLDFGAVDILWNERYKTAFTLEINTAPGLEGSTINDYSKFFCKILNLEEVKEDAPNFTMKYIVDKEF